jgi:serine/threonine protein kinase/Tol biopolymer transport system component
MLSPGTRLGHYEIVCAIGAGGMGEVYKARDTRLERTVALKVLLSAHAADVERKLRFEREARSISSLNHPHICALYDVGEQDGVQFLVMEYLEGETLEQRLRKGPLPLDEALRCAVQMAEALDQAHRHGIVHRDLKPANVILTRNGVKLLDFGLAKALQPVSSSAGATSLPTVSQTLTTQGSIVGTWQYMAPEQLEGMEADARSDIFSFGAVMYEMLTGKRAFEGRSQASLIAAIMHTSPEPLSAVQPMIPPALDHVVQTCLAKDPDERWQAVHDVLVQLKWIPANGPQLGAGEPVAAQHKNGHWMAWAIAGLAMLGLSALSWSHFSEPRAVAAPVRFIITPPAGADFNENTTPTLSPDGRKLVFTTVSPSGGSTIWLRLMDSADPRELARGAFPFWSPDSRFVGFFSDGNLQRVDIAGGPPVTLSALGSGLGGSWSREGVILVGASRTDPALRRISAAGGELKHVLEPDKASNEIRLSWPAFLPDGRHFLYVSTNADNGKSGVRIGSLDSKDIIPLLSLDRQASFVEPGYLLVTRQRSLVAQPFSPQKLRFTGEAVPIAEGIGANLAPGGDAYSASQNGVLAFRRGGTEDLKVVWYDRSGRSIAPAIPPGQYRQVALSPDGKRAAIERFDTPSNQWGIWLLELSSSILSRLTSGAAENTDPVWSPDSRQVAFASNRNGHLDIFRQSVGAAQAEPVWADKERKVPEAWLKDGTILFTTANGKDYFVVSEEGRGRPKQIFHADYSTDEPMVSPDGRWVAFNSLESGRWEVCVAAFPGFSDKRQVSKDGGAQGRWRADGKELFFLGLDGKMMAVDVKPGQTIETGAPRMLFQTAVRINPFWDQYGVTNDGARFLMTDSYQQPANPITVLLNWPELLRH